MKNPFRATSEDVHDLYKGSQAESKVRMTVRTPLKPLGKVPICIDAVGLVPLGEPEELHVLGALSTPSLLSGTWTCSLDAWWNDPPTYARLIGSSRSLTRLLVR